MRTRPRRLAVLLLISALGLARDASAAADYVPPLEAARREIARLFDAAQQQERRGDRVAMQASADQIVEVMRRCWADWSNEWAMYRRLRTGASYFEVACLLGSPGTQISDSQFGGIHMTMYQWKTPADGTITLMFENYRLP